MFQYPLRVLGCEKIADTLSDPVFWLFQYPLRVLGCEKNTSGKQNGPLTNVSVPSAGSWL